MFQIDSSNKLIIDPDLLAIPEFKAIWESDSSKSKELAYSTFEYIYFMCDPKSPYNNYPPDKKEKFIREDFIRDKDIKESNPLIKSAILKYNSLVKVPEHYLLESARNALFKVSQWLDTTKIRDGKDGNIQSVIASIKNLASSLNSYDQIKEAVEKEVSKQGVKRGKGSVGSRER
jgi:hypothetical protein